MKTMIRNKYNVERNHSQSNNHLNQSLRQNLIIIKIKVSEFLKIKNGRNKYNHKSIKKVMIFKIKS